MRRDEAPPSPYPISCDAARLPFHPPPLPPPPPISSVPRPGFVLCAPPLSPPTSAVPRQGSALRPQARALHHPASGRPAWWDNRKCGRSHNMQGALKLALCITQLQGTLRGGTRGSVGVRTIQPSQPRRSVPHHICRPPHTHTCDMSCRSLPPLPVSEATRSSCSVACRTEACTSHPLGT